MRESNIEVGSLGILGLSASASDQVDILFTQATAPEWDIHALPANVRILSLASFVARDRRIPPPSSAIATAYAVYRFVAENAYDVVHCRDAQGLGFYVAMACRQGLLGTMLVTHLQDASYKRRVVELTPPSLEDVEGDAIERSQIEMSHWVVSPSAYLIERYRSLDVSLQQHRIVIFDAGALRSAPRIEAGAVQTRRYLPDAVQRFVYVGPQRRSDGFEVFLKALALLPRALHREVVFLGPFCRIDGECSASMALRCLASYAGTCQFLDSIERSDALRLLAQDKGSLCVMPSLVGGERSAVLDCFVEGIPFLASDLGEAVELVAPECRARCLVSPEPKDLAKAITRVMENGIDPIACPIDPNASRLAWKNFHARIRTEQTEVQPVSLSDAAAPLVSVCLIHHERPAMARSALNALMAQTYDTIEIILVDDGSRSQAAIDFLNEVEHTTWRFKIRVVRSDNFYLGAARNLAARHAEGEFIVFHDDDNIAEPDEIATFVRAIVSSGFDILTSFFWMFRTADEGEMKDRRKIEYFPLGTGGAFSYFKNRFGDANAIIRRSAFEQIGGFTEIFGAGLEDWELFLRAWLRGQKLGVVPEPLFNYRISPSAMRLSGNESLSEERLYRAAESEKAPVSGDLLRLAKAPYRLEEMRSRLEALLEGQPGADAHIALLDLPLGDPNVKNLLSDIAFELGRYADAWALGATDPAQRAKLQAAGVTEDEAARRPVFLPAVDKPEIGSGAEALCLVGWGLANGNAAVPELLTIDGVGYEYLAHVSLDRSDVVRHFDVSAEVKSGFALLVQKSPGQKPLRRRGLLRKKGVTIAGSSTEKIRIVKPAAGFTGFIDDIFRYHIFEISHPSNQVDRQLSVKTNRPSVVFASTGGDNYRPMSLTPKTLARVKGFHSGNISLAIPDDGETEVWVQ